MAQYRISSPRGDDPGGWYDQLRRGLDDLLLRSGTEPAPSVAVYPAVNFYETGDGYVLTAELPGLGSDDIDLSLEGNRVTLRGERKIEHPQEGSLHRVERPSGAFSRTLELPSDVDADKVEAVHRNGVLMLRLPKTPEQQPRRIAIRKAKGGKR